MQDSGRLPALPPRPRRAGSSSTVAPAHGPPAGDLSRLTTMAEQLASNSGVARLLANPEVIQSVIKQDPGLQALMASNPQMASLLSTEKLASMMQALRDPSSMVQSGVPGVLPEDTDMSHNRRTLLEVQQYAQNLHRRAQPDQGSITGGQPGTGAAAGQGSVAGIALEQSVARATERMAMLMELRHMQAAGGGGSVHRPIVNAPSLSGWHSQPVQQFYSPAAAFESQQHQQQQHQGLDTGTTAPLAANAMAPVRAMHPPLQHEPLYSGLHDEGSHEGGAYQGSYTFSYSEKDVALQDLPEDMQAQLLAQLADATSQQGPGTAMGQAHGHQGHQHGPGCSHSPGGQHAGLPGVADGSMAPGSEAAKQLYGRLYQQYSESMRAYEATAGSGPQDGGYDRPDPSAMWAAYYQAYPAAAQEAATQPGTGGAATAGRRVASAQYYEHVTPSSWKPDKQDDCCELYRRAYCSRADAVWPPMWLALSYLAATCLPFFPFLALLVVLPALFVAGMAFFAMVLAGIPSSELATSRTIASFIASLELAIWAVAVGWILPAYTPRWGMGSLVLGASLTLLPLLHLAAHLTNPGYVEPDPPTTDASEAHNGTDMGNKVKPDHASSGSSAAHATKGLGSSLHGTAQGGDPEGAGEHQPLLEGQHEAGGGLSKFSTCVTCKVHRPLRSKHCPICNRCVHRLDHHCPAIYNCVGAGNHRLFAAYLMCMVVAQASWLSVGFSFMQQLYEHEALRQQPGTTSQTVEAFTEGVWCSMAAVSYAASGAHRGFLLLLLVQVPLFCAGLILVSRISFGIAANLTTNEMINRKRYTYLVHEIAGYSNRFDRGMAHNCFQFWLEPRQDWWTLFETGDREMVSRRMTMLSTWSPGVILRFFDVLGVRRTEIQRHLQERRLAQQLQQQAGGTLEAARLKELVTAGLGKDMEGGECRSGGCNHHH